MAWALREATASQEVPLGPFLDTADGNTEETGITVANTEILLFKTGGTTLPTKNSGNAVHISNGIFYAVLDATDTDTVGPMMVFAKDSAALWVKQECVVLPANVYDSMFSTDKLQVDVVQIAGQTASAAGAVTFPGTLASTTNITTAAGCAVSSLGANVITAAATAADFGTEIGAAVLAAAAADPIDANVEQVNTVAIVGDGSGTPWGP